MIPAGFGMALTQVDSDWYATAFKPEMAEMTWAEHTGREVDRLIKMLKLKGPRRMLDLACGNGRHALELARRGHQVVGVELSADLLDVARADAEAAGVDVEYVQADIREIDFDEKFDIVLNLNDGAIGYLESDEENERIFAAVARLLHSEGRQLMQLPNILHAEAHLPQKTWIAGNSSIEILEHEFNEEDRCLYGAMHLIREGQTFSFDDRIVFRQRLYSLEEIDTILRKYGMYVSNSFRGNGRARPPTDSQYEVFVQGTKA